MKNGRQNCRRIIKSGCPLNATLYDWVPGLSGAPDEPHAVNVSAFRTEGNGVGVLKEPPVDVKAKTDNYNGVKEALTAEAQNSCCLCFHVALADCMEVSWETLLVGDRLFVEIPTGILPAGSKESFVTLLEYAEEVLRCNHVIVCFRKDRNDRACLIRTFMFLGFGVLEPGNRLVPCSGDLLYMSYNIDQCDSDDDDDD